MEENVQKYEFNKDKITYKLRTSIIDGKYIKIVCNPKNQKYGYFNVFSKDDLMKVNFIFSSFSNIKQIQEEFDKCILTKKVSLFHNRTLFDIFFYITKEGKREKIPLNLIYENEYDSNKENKENKNNKENKKNYNDVLIEIEKEIIIMEKEQEKIKDKVDKILSQFDEENINSKNKIYFNERKLKNFIKSSIIKTQEEYNLIKNKLLSKRKSQICKNINYKLLYKASKDSDKVNIFHQKCDNKKNTLILIETDKGNKFGGFTTQTWEGNINKKDESAFLFSLDKLKIYDIIEDQNAISCNPNYGPIFCEYQIFIFDNFFQQGGRTGKASLNYNTQEDFELNDGIMVFKIKKLEVFEIFFE